LSEEKEISKPDSTPLFENNFAFINDEGELVLKETAYFEQRTLGKVDPESVEELAETLENAFEDVRGSVDDFFEKLEEETDFEVATVRERFEKLKESVLSAEAIGDFEGLMNEVNTRFNQALSSLEEEIEKSAEAPEAAADKSEAPKPAVESEKEPPAEVKTESVQKDPEPEPEPEAKLEPGPEAEPEPESESKVPVVAAAEGAGDEAKPAPEEKEDKKDAEGELPESEAYYKSLADKAEQLAEVSDWAYVAMEFDNIDTAWGEGPDTAELDVDISTYREQIDQQRKKFEEKKQAHYEEQKRRKQENLEKKKAILESMQKIVDEAEWENTKEVGRLKGKWERIKAVPADSAEELEKNFNALLSTFDDHKVDRLVKKKQKEEDNLTGKLVILEKMESFVGKLDENSNWKEMEEKFEQLAKQFRKIGRVPVEKNQEVWNSYHQLQDTFHSMRFKHDKNYRNTIEKYLSRKKKLIDEAEALIDADDLADAARKVNKLHRRWKKAGNLPQKDENELWDRFKAATDAFNEKKSENIDVLRDQEQENLQEKHTLIEKAEALKDSEDWEQTHRELQSLMDKWKNIGPVPKRSSGKIWKKFKGAMDQFYDRRREHFKEVKEERKDNLKEKEEVLDKLRELRDHEDPIEAVNLAKPLQTEFKKAGYVPIKHKNRLWKEYREICDVIYDRFRAAKAAVEVVGRENVENFSVDDIADIRKMNSKASSLRKQISKMEQELIQQKESLSYFKPKGKSNPLLDQVKEKIENAEAEIASKENQLAELEKKISQIKKDGE